MIKHLGLNETAEHGNPPASIQGRHSFFVNNTLSGVSKAKVRVALAPEPASDKGK